MSLSLVSARTSPSNCAILSTSANDYQQSWNGYAMSSNHLVIITIYSRLPWVVYRMHSFKGIPLTYHSRISATPRSAYAKAKYLELQEPMGQRRTSISLGRLQNSPFV